MHDFKNTLDQVEDIIAIAIFLCLIIVALAKFEIDILETVFYLVLAAIISPFTKINRPAKRLLLVFGFIWGVLLGYFTK
ncbi:hypothetical protein IQ243_25985 [Nostocales cyanobacterium LEGE 11386]|nr:hypothetical protein [Nostocales cyanobacterium LEGE 11386]